MVERVRTVKHATLRLSCAAEPGNLFSVTRNLPKSSGRNQQLTIACRLAVPALRIVWG
jgi:uncharacterized membrane protein